jgi:hypothetical protein
MKTLQRDDKNRLNEIVVVAVLVFVVVVVTVVVGHKSYSIFLTHSRKNIFGEREGVNFTKLL